MRSVPDSRFVLAAIAAKSARELAYHRDYAAQWVIRLGDGTELSHARMQAALEALWPLADELFRADAVSAALPGVAADPAGLRAEFDDVLAAVGAVIGDSLRGGDFAARYGGEEFLILLPGADVDTGSQIAERIRAGVAALRIPSVDQRITISLGLAVAPDHAVDAETLTRAADRALYAAKKGGRNRLAVSAIRSDPSGADFDHRHEEEVSVGAFQLGDDSRGPNEPTGSGASVPLAL